MRSVLAQNLNLRGGFKKTIMDYIAGKYPDLVPLYDEIYNKHNRSYFEALEVKAEKMAKKYDCAFVEYVKEIFAQYDRQCIRVYQAYNPLIAKEAVLLQTFGKNFNVNRMTWIKPSFLWMMYRSNWGTKKNQECILAIDIYQSYFNKLLEKAVLTSPDSASYTGTQWEKAFDETTVYCQWDPDGIQTEMLFIVRQSRLD